MTSIPRNRYECPECGNAVDIWHNNCPRDGARGKYTPANVGCPNCETYMEQQTND